MLIIYKNALPLTGGLAQAGQWLARKLVQIFKFCARPSGRGSHACAKPLGRYLQAAEVRSADKEVENEHKMETK